MGLNLAGTLSLQKGKDKGRQGAPDSKKIARTPKATQPPTRPLHLDPAAQPLRVVLTGAASPKRHRSSQKPLLPVFQQPPGPRVQGAVSRRH